MATISSDVYRRLAYYPTLDEDNLAKGKQSGFAPVSPTLARRLKRANLYSYYVHGNSKVIAWEGNKDVSAQYKLIRLIRHWTGKLSSGETPRPVVTTYSLDSASAGPRGFGPDYGPDSWVDSPGPKTDGAPPGNFRYLQEFVAAVGHPYKDMSPIADFGGLHYIVAFDITPKRYRVWMSLARTLLPTQVEGALGIPGKIFPSDVVWDGAPDFEALRYLPNSWEEYHRFKGERLLHLSR